ncbi:MAG TPA: 3-dehydroquinate synthase family protein, partial [Thermoanaerobaculia bacterium]
ILIGEGALAEARAHLEGWVAGRTVFLLSTSNVLALHGAALEPLAAAAARWIVLTVPDGEAAKTVATAEGLWREMAGAGGKRDSRLIAFGGGSAGDLGGFVAGCFLRGIACVQMPTTLLAQVDAAIGGKTAVDLPEGKNAVGLFRHPEMVVAETGFLATLAREELRAGLVEAIKMAALLDVGLLARIEEDLEPLLAGDPAVLAPVAAAAAAAKIGVVERDPEEGGERRLLNFGHTLGHAIEAAAGYTGPGSLRHGEAVAYGILFALRLAVRRGLPPAAAARLTGLLARLGLPPLPPLAADDLLARLGRDKKAREAGLAWVLPRALGDGRIATDVERGELAAELPRFLADPFAVPVR